MPTVKKKKVKKNVIYLFAAVVFIIVAIILGINYYNDYKYQQTNEYKLIEKGYLKEDALKLLAKLNETQINNLLTKDKDENVLSIIDEKYYIEKNLDTYLEYYRENPDKSSYDIVAIVNVGANKDWYEGTFEADLTKGPLLLVNKFNKLSPDFTPEDLTLVKNWYCYGENQLAKVAYEAFIDLYNKAKEDEIKLFINSSYRNYSAQEKTYNDLKNTYGTKRADSQAARPGHSEHETGLSFDVFTPGNSSTENFKDSAAYTWLKTHAHEFGFIERYPEDKEYLTGYNFESWHWRYVGIETANIIHEEEITFDEYYAYYIAK